MHKLISLLWLLGLYYMSSVQAGHPTAPIAGADLGGPAPHLACSLSGYTAHPVNTLAGNKFKVEVDYAGSAGSFPLHFIRYYNQRPPADYPESGLGPLKKPGF